MTSASHLRSCCPHVAAPEWLDVRSLHRQGGGWRGPAAREASIAWHAERGARSARSARSEGQRRKARDVEAETHAAWQNERTRRKGGRKDVGKGVRTGMRKGGQMGESGEEEEKGADATRVERRLALPSEEVFLGAGLALKDEVGRWRYAVHHGAWARAGVLKTDPFLYTGLLGTAFVCLRAFHVTRSRADLDLAADITRAAAELAETAPAPPPAPPASNSLIATTTHMPPSHHITPLFPLRSCHSLLATHPRSPISVSRHSFFCGQPGIFALGAVVAHLQRRQHDSEKFLRRFLDLITDALPALSQRPSSTNDIAPAGIPYELLYGRAGLLWAAMFIRQHLGRAAVPDSRYWGAAHGLAGIAHTLLLGERHVGQVGHVGHVGRVGVGEAAASYAEGEAGEEVVEEGGREAVAVLEWMVAGKLPSGNYPSSDEKRLAAAGGGGAGGGGAGGGGAGGGGAGGDAVRAAAGGADRLVQWCHGAPGVAMALAHAATALLQWAFLCAHAACYCFHGATIACLFAYCFHLLPCNLCFSISALPCTCPLSHPYPAPVTPVQAAPAGSSGGSRRGGMAALSSLLCMPFPTPPMHQSHPSRQHLLAAAVAAGEVAWQRGLLRKMGLCHGIAGSHSSNRQTNSSNSSNRQTNSSNSSNRQTNSSNSSNRQTNSSNSSNRQPNSSNSSNRQTNSMQENTTPALPPPSTHLHRARVFAAFLVAHRQRLAHAALLHCGDRPFSLMEGLGIVACLFLDLARPDDAQFPGFEL
ncbi:unnamed protein product [Closterium sp. Naga37s-1]|nr:unnamed protein product [Closterium sp. Naga37s-1]